MFVCISLCHVHIHTLICIVSGEYAAYIVAVKPLKRILQVYALRNSQPKLKRKRGVFAGRVVYVDGAKFANNRPTLYFSWSVCKIFYIIFQNK